jgi:uncharacterized protein YegJ (DUF2314 family)
MSVNNTRTYLIAAAFIGCDTGIACNTPKDKVLVALSTTISPPTNPPSAPVDQPVHASSKDESKRIHNPIAPCVAAARATYPDAKKRFLLHRLSDGKFSLLTEIRSPGRTEMVFVTVLDIQGDQITSTISNDIVQVVGFHRGDRHSFAESEIIDWVFSRSDGTEDGNLVGKFLDTWDPSRNSQLCDPSL